MVTRFYVDMDGSMEPSEDGSWVRFDDLPGSSFATTTMTLIEDYAKAVHAEDGAACVVLREVIKSSLEGACYG